jgi:hypothetical protein
VEADVRGQAIYEAVPKPAGEARAIAAAFDKAIIS